MQAEPALDWAARLTARAVAAAFLRAALLVGSYAAFGLQRGIAGGVPHRDNLLVLVIAVLVLLAGLQRARVPWWTAVAAALALGLVHGLLTWAVGQRVGLERPETLAELLGRDGGIGVSIGGLSTATRWLQGERFGRGGGD